MLKNSDDISLKIEPVVGFTKNISLMFKGEDITPDEYETGKVDGVGWGGCGDTATYMTGSIMTP